MNEPAPAIDGYVKFDNALSVFFCSQTLIRECRSEGMIWRRHMKQKELLRSSHYDYDNVIARFKAAQKSKNDASPSRRSISAPKPSPSAWSRLINAFRDESKQLIAASLAALGLLVWFGSSTQAYFAQNSDASLAAACQKSEFSHAGSIYCVDSRKMAHILKPDGTLSKPGLDWRVDENHLRKVEAEAAREARHMRAIEP
jgi:hypothetical protein